ncbi:MAG: helix-turn-helix transcriptional regulator [Candidatus Acidiferrales bacterium]
MGDGKKGRVALERLSRNPRESRQSQSLGGKPLIGTRRKLQEVRQELGVSQAQLAKVAGIPTAAISNIEADRYAVSARVGSDIYTAVARMAVPQSSLYREAKQEAARLIAFQRELSLSQIESLRKKLRSVTAMLRDLDGKEARLREI